MAKFDLGDFVKTMAVPDSILVCLVIERGIG